MIHLNDISEFFIYWHVPWDIFLEIITLLKIFDFQVKLMFLKTSKFF